MDLLLPLFVMSLLEHLQLATISWYHNGELDQSRGNFSTTRITVTDATDGDVFTCRAENKIGFDHQQQTIIRFVSKTFCIAT